MIMRGSRKKTVGGGPLFTSFLLFVSLVVEEREDPNSTISGS